MPSAATIVQDVINGSVTQIGTYPRDTVGIPLCYDVSKPHCLRAGYGFFKTRFDGSKVHFTPNKTLHLVEGTFAEFDVDNSVLALMDHTCKICVSGFFSGCEWQIYRVKPAMYYCVHVPRSGDEPDKWTRLMATYARAANWTLLAAYQSAGVVGTTGGTVWFVSQLLPNQRIDTVRILMSKRQMSAALKDQYGMDIMGSQTVTESRIIQTTSYTVNA